MKLALTLLVYTLIFFFIPLVGALGPLGYIATKHYPEYQVLHVKQPFLVPFAIYFYLTLQLVLSCATIYLLAS